MAIRTKFFALFLFVFCILYLGRYTPKIFAQTPPDTTNASSQVEGEATLGVANMVGVKNANVQDGSILSASPQGAILSTTPYDSQVLGIVSRDAGIILSTSDDKNSVPVISNGTVYVLVSSQQGDIKKQDLITTSTIPGVGVKAVDAGYVLGYALEDYSNPNPKQAGKIAVNLSLHYFNSKPTFAGTLTDILKIVLLPTKNSPAAIYKYLVAAAVVLGSFVLGFISFGRTAAKGVEALGRNPAASAVIHLGIIFNVGIVIAIILAGLSVAFLILRL
jgi:hypothetical protein